MFSIVVFVIAVVSFAVFQFRSYVLTDRTGPSIAMEEERVTVSVDADDGQLLAGISAVDDKDGDVWDQAFEECFSATGQAVAGGKSAGEMVTNLVNISI